MAPFNLISPTAWRLLAAIVIADVVLCAALGLRVAPLSLATAITTFCGASALAWFYTAKRPTPDLAMMAMALAYLVLVTPAGAVLSYATNAFNLPLWDDTYHALDVAMGFDWMAMLAVIDQHPFLAMFLRMMYSSSLPHVALVIVALSVATQHDRLRAFLVLFAATAALTCFVSGLLPALAAFAYYAPPAELRDALGQNVGSWHIAHVLGLRDGSFRMIDIAKVQGIVTFPSFHTTLAILCGWATWTVRRITWPSAIVAAIIVAATPHIGGHYFIDLIGGGIIAAVAIYVVWQPRTRAVQRLEAAAAAS